MYTIVEVPTDAPTSGEFLGTKRKFWYDDTSRGKCLFKLARSGTGEDWSEKIAEQIAMALNIPCANYELATYDGQRGVVSPRMHSDQESLLIGNELLADMVSRYEESTKHGGNQHHTVQNVLNCLESKAVPTAYTTLPGLNNAADVFIGYLLLDALIGNTDRHHENWACITTNRGGNVSLAPTFDHASSLGRELQEQRCIEMLATRDKNRTVESYAVKARSLMYESSNDTSTLSAMNAFALAQKYRPDAAAIWLNALDDLDKHRIEGFFRELPTGYVSGSVVNVAVRIVVYNKARLLA